MSYDVSALFTSIAIDPAIKTIKKHLEEDQDLSKRTSMTVDHIISLLEFCLRNTYFSFQGRYYEQTEGAAMGSPISSLVANLFMEEFEKTGHQHFYNTTNPMEEICWWHFHSHQKEQQRWLPGTSEFHQPKDTIHLWRDQRRWIHALPGHSCNTWRWWQPKNISV